MRCDAERKRTEKIQKSIEIIGTEIDLNPPAPVNILLYKSRARLRRAASNLRQPLASRNHDVWWWFVSRPFFIVLSTLQSFLLLTFSCFLIVLGFGVSRSLVVARQQMKWERWSWTAARRPARSDSRAKTHHSRCFRQCVMVIYLFFHT